MVKNKVVFITNSSWNIVNFRKNLIFSFLNENNVIVISGDRKYEDQIKSWGVSFIKVSFPSLNYLFLNFFISFFKMIYIFIKEKPDYCFSFTIYPNILSGLVIYFFPRTKFSPNVAGLGRAFRKKGLLNFVASILYKICFLKATNIFFQNREDVDEVLSRHSKERSKVILVPGSGIDVNRFKKDNDLEKKDFIFLFFSRLLKSKGILEFLEAAKILRSKKIKAKFLVAGPILKKDRDAISSNEIRNWHQSQYIEYKGEIKDVREILDISSCVVLPTYYNEGVPRVLLEAGAFSLPLIASNSRGCRDVLKDGFNGLFCPTKDPIGLSDTMLKLFNMSDRKIEEMGINSRKMIEENFDEKVVIQKYLNLLPH